MLKNPIAQAIANEVGAKWHPTPTLLDCHSNWFTRKVETPPPDSGLELVSFTHECGHLATTKAAQQAGKPVSVIEWLATKWGFDAILRHGGTVTEEMRQWQARALMGYLVNEPQSDLVYHAAERVEMAAFLRPYRDLPPLVDDRPR